jgi:hypothetical protein
MARVFFLFFVGCVLVSSPCRATGALRLLGEFHGTTTVVDGEPTAWTFTLWQHSEGYVGTFDYFPTGGGIPQCGMLRHVEIEPVHGDVRFSLRLAPRHLGGTSSALGETWDVFEFLGTWAGDQLTGRLWQSLLDSDEQPSFPPVTVSLNRRTASVFPEEEYVDFNRWLAAAEAAMQACKARAEAVWSTRVIPAKPVRGWSVGIAGGLANALGEGSELWEPGTSYGFDGFYSLSRYFAVGAQFVTNRWELDPLGIVQQALPVGATLASLTTSGSAQIIELSAAFRLTSGDRLGERFQLFGQLAATGYYLRFQAAASLGYNFNGGTTASEFKDAIIDDSQVRGGLGSGGGLTVGVTRDWSVDAYALYHAIFDVGGSTEYLTVLLSVRLDLR